ncbi:F-box-like domain superfamily [Arabidopsis thaliana x Arabidopsis arenosa]|uniref:F-box-like domain superfamily n=1 Tax=Arabidopsis thaliana x Arabidopsis arenosa TaxID=1240361 RepID=A0A8T2C3Q1_9BRAS|nr:F-box-like domain superfamily [Arabidopsis thaliana x Arabidopsis arenosa]
MTTMSDLSHDLVEEILCMVPITSLRAVRSTCKLWNVLSKNRILCKAEARNQFLGFTMMNHRLYSMRFNLHGIDLNEDGEEFTDPSIKPIGDILNQVEISKVFYCEGLLLCVTRNHSSKLVVWNPYLGQTRWIQPSSDYYTGVTYALGYDNNKNHKILSFFAGEGYYEIYDLKSNSWSFSYVIPKKGLKCYQPGASLNGNAYFLTDGRKVMEGYDCLLGFDFTTEKFGPLLSLSFSHDFMDTAGRLSCVKGEKLAVLYQRYYTSEMEVWVTTKIEPNAVSWSKFLAVDMEPLTSLKFNDDVGSFFIDEEKKIAVVFDLDESERYNTAYIIGDNGCLKEVDLDEAVNPQESVEVGDRMFSFSPFVCSCSYVPSLVKINQIAEHERKDKKRKRERKRTNKLELHY